MENEEKTKELTARVQANLRSLFLPENHGDFLRLASRFPNYMPRNIVLLFLQNRNAAQIAEYGCWKAQGRQVRANEKSLTILAPTKVTYSTAAPRGKTERLEKNENRKIVTLVGFKPQAVFDISQTNSKSGENAAVVEQTADYEKLFLAVKKAAPCPVGFEYTANEGQGEFQSGSPRIAIQIGLSDDAIVCSMLNQLARVFIYENYADARADNSKESVLRLTDSLSYLLKLKFGLSPKMEFDAVYAWGKNASDAELKKSLKIILDSSRILIAEIQMQFCEIKNAERRIREFRKPELLFEKIQGARQKIESAKSEMAKIKEG